MERIKVIYNSDRKILKIPVVLFTPHKRIISDFILDTGSPHTIINYTDSIRLGIPHINKGEMIRMAGRVYQSYIYERLFISFKSIDNEEIKENLPVRIVKPFSLKMKEIENLDRFPDILGLDFLEKYKFICNIPNNEVFLEKIM